MARPLALKPQVDPMAQQEAKEDTSDDKVVVYQEILNPERGY